MRRGQGNDGKAWEKVFDAYRKAVDKETLDNGQPSIRILNRRGPEIQDWCNHDVLNYNSRLVGIPDEWQGSGALTEALDQRG